MRDSIMSSMNCNIANKPRTGNEMALKRAVPIPVQSFVVCNSHQQREHPHDISVLESLTSLSSRITVNCSDQAQIDESPLKLPRVPACLEMDSSEPISPRRSARYCLQQQQLQQSHAEMQKQMKRRVRFNEAGNVWHESTFNWEYAHCIWFQHEDYTKFRRDTYEVVEELKKDEDLQAGRILEHIYEHCRSQYNPNNSNWKMAREERRNFKNLYRVIPDLIGLERQICPDIYRERKRSRNHLIAAVEDVQSCGWPNLDTEVENLYQTSHEISRTSRSLSFLLAWAIAPTEAENNNKEDLGLFAESVESASPMSMEHNRPANAIQ